MLYIDVNPNLLEYEEEEPVKVELFVLYIFLYAFSRAFCLICISICIL